MAKQLFVLLATLAVAAGSAMAVEEIMPMHPGAPYNEVGLGIAVAPIRRATSEDAPARRPRPEQLHRNKVTLKIPAPAVPNERRLRMVEARVNSTDGSIDFDLDNAPLLSRSAEIPGMVEPEYLAMDKFNLADSQPPEWPEEPAGRRETPLRERLDFNQAEAATPARAHAAAPPRTEAKAKAKATVTYPDTGTTKKAAGFTQPSIPDLPSPAPTAMATGDRGGPKFPDLPEAAPGKPAATPATSSLRPPSEFSVGNRSSVAPPETTPSRSLKPPSMGMDYADTGTLDSGLSVGSFDSDGGLTLSSTRMDMTSINSLTQAAPETIRHEPWSPNMRHIQSIQNLEAADKPRRQPAPLPEPDEYGLTPMRELRSVVGPINLR